jgi:hypothetical protein
MIETHSGQSDVVERVGAFVGSLKQALREHPRVEVGAISEEPTKPQP